MKRPESVLVLLHDHDHEILLLRRIGADGFWQSVTGSLEQDEKPLDAALREVREETGIDLPAERLRCWQLRNRYPIPERWRSRYAPGVTHNREHLFSACVDRSLAVRYCPEEHQQIRWVPAAEALALVWSWTNRDAIRLLLSG